ncbi:MAG: HD domain-containing protein [Lachnospiraceae bacterium]|nr:HD domain-containing protein [Lachnospiraceae bacterium]
MRLTTVIADIKSRLFAVCMAALAAICTAMFFCGDKAYAATGERDLLGEGTNYTSILYNSQNGLPTSEANAIAQSSDGFIWIGMYSGLIRYDGTNFYRFDASTGISSVLCLYVDSKDRVWIGTNENGVACYDHGDINVYGRLEGMKSYSIRAITEDDAGNILIATTQGMAYIDPGLEFHIIDDPHLNNEYISEIHKDDDGIIYGLTLDGDVFKINDLATEVFYSHERINGYSISSICPVPGQSGVLYMGTQNSEFLIVRLSDSVSVERKYDIAPIKTVAAIFESDGITWIAASNGIGYIDSGKVYHTLTDIPLNNSIECVIKDHEGNMWFTSTRQGVMKMVNDCFTDISSMAGLGTMVVNSTCVRGDLLYIATDEGLKIVSLKDYSIRENELTKLLDGVRIRCIKGDSKNNLWLCTHGRNGLVCYGIDGKITLYNEAAGLEADRVRACIERKDGSIAVATSNGLYLINKGKVTGHYGQEDGINNLEILSVAEGPDERLYIGSDGAGIFVIDGAGVTHLGHEDGLTSDVVMRIKWDDERQMFWMITSNSIQYMKDGRIFHVSNFPYSNNFDICFDIRGRAWILSSNGIYVAKVDDLVANRKVEYRFYDTQSGLQYITTANSRNYMDEAGRLYISGSTGVCMVDINMESDTNNTVKLAIPSVIVDGEVIPLKGKDTVTLAPNSKRLNINAYAITYKLNNLRISYHLSGFDQGAIQTTKQDMETISYTNLDGGRYVFYLNVINEETGQIDKSASITIIKEAAIYERAWFWALVMIVTILLVGFIIWKHFQKKNRILLEKQEEDEKFINQIIHTFAKCIDTRDRQNRGHSFRVAYYTRLLAEKLKEKRGYTREQINEFYNIALLHDIGKLSIPDAILNKNSKLDDNEYMVMKSHAAIGADILKDVNIVKGLSTGAGCHHERIDGKGYPNGLKGDEIPEVARIIAVADTFDAMYSTRPYRKQLDINVVLEEIKRIRGTQLEEDVVDALLELCEEGVIEWNKVNEELFGKKP